MANEGEQESPRIPHEPSNENWKWSLEVALSGGGLRATAYSLGALLYLAQVGLNRHVKNVASVSGGSITNAFVAGACEYSATNIEEFRQKASILANTIAYDGLLNRWQTVAFGVLAIGVPIVMFIGLGFALGLSGAASFLIALAIALIIWRCRGVAIASWQASVLSKARPGFGSACLGELKDRHTEHIFCATDLTFAAPIFFSGGFGGRLLSTRHGCADGSKLPILTAVRASSAFPPLIPPLAYRSDGPWCGLVDYEPKTWPPIQYRLWLTDGGTFNNFGTDWHLARNDLTNHEFAYQLNIEKNARPFGVTQDQYRNSWTRYQIKTKRYGQVQLVIDASAADNPKTLDSLYIPLYGAFKYMRRASDAMYGSTLASRLDLFEIRAVDRMRKFPKKWLASHRCWKDGRNTLFQKYPEEYDPVHDFEDDTMGALQVFAPYHQSIRRFAEQWTNLLRLDDVSKDRQNAWRTELENASNQLGELFPNNEPVKTTFAALGRDTTLKLIVAGYLMTREAVFCAFDFGPERVPTREWFEDLLPTRR